jgi:hypothetical protein
MRRRSHSLVRARVDSDHALAHTRQQVSVLASGIDDAERLLLERVVRRHVVSLCRPHLRAFL